MKMALTDGMRLWREINEDVYIAAYGSNLVENRMETRCPSAVPVGTSVICGYRMLFKQSMTGAYATIEQDANRTVPCIAFKISEYDEALLDKYEGYPKYYYKRKFDLKILFNSGKKSKEPRRCVAYILHEERNLGEPPKDYVGLLINAYRHWGYDERLIWTALKDSIGEEAGLKYMKEFLKGGREG